MIVQAVVLIVIGEDRAYNTSENRFKSSDSVGSIVIPSILWRQLLYTFTWQ